MGDGGGGIMRMETSSAKVTAALRWECNPNPDPISELLNKSGVKMPT